MPNDEDDNVYIRDDENDNNYTIMMEREMIFIYDRGEGSGNVLCASNRVVHINRSLALICELFEYVYTRVSCRIYFYAFI